MKPYGRYRGDCWCCPGHDKFPKETYSNRRSKHAQTRDTKVMHRAERRRQRVKTHVIVNGDEEVINESIWLFAA